MQDNMMLLKLASCFTYEFAVMVKGEPVMAG